MSEDARKLRDDAIARLDEADTLVFRIMHTGGALEGERVLGAGVARRSTRRSLLMRVFAMEEEADFHAVRKGWSEEALESFRDS